VTPEQVTEAVCERVASRSLLPAMEDVVAGITADVKERIGVPVEYAGGHVIRSKPGEPPRTEFGDYINSWTYTVVRNGDVITGTSGSTLPGRGVWLEKGTGRIRPRPHVEPAYQQARAEAGPQIKQNL
jgi:hypothetical protein